MKISKRILSVILTFVMLFTAVPFVFSASAETGSGGTRSECTDPNGHSYEETVISPTCTKEGYTKHECTICGNKYISDRTPALAHDFKDSESITPPTCTEDGVIVRHCIRCGEDEIEVIPYTGHKDNDHDGKCDNCSAPIVHYVQCKCRCHSDRKTDQILYKISLMFWKLFKTHKKCDCGIEHY